MAGVAEKWNNQKSDDMVPRGMRKEFLAFIKVCLYYVAEKRIIWNRI